MNNENTVSQRRPFDHTDQPARFSRRRLLVTGTGALAGALPVLATATSVAAADPAEPSAALEQASDRQRRIAAILELHGPELGSGR